MLHAHIKYKGHSKSSETGTVSCKICTSYSVTSQHISCNLNVLGPVFLQSSDSTVEESLIMVFQPAICRADNVPPPSKSPTCMGDLNPYLIDGSLSSPKSSSQTTSWSVQPFLQGSTLWQTDRLTNRQTDHAKRYLHSSEMQPNYKLCNTVTTDATNQWHNTNEIYDVHLSVFKLFESPLCITYDHLTQYTHSVLWRCRLGDRKGIWPVKTCLTNPKSFFVFKRHSPNYNNTGKLGWLNKNWKYKKNSGTSCTSSCKSSSSSN